MALSDFLFNTGNKIRMGLSRFAPSQNYVSPSGDYDPRQFNNYPAWYQGEKVQPRLTMSEMLLGQKAQTPAQEGQAVTDENGNTTLKMGASEAPRTGGILPDIMSGFDENRNNAFSLNNLEQGTLEDGRKKGFAYKLGEGLGSIARIANTPLGRGLIVGGLVTATGGNPLQALAYGGGATMMNQQNVLKDQMYRNDLANQGIDTTGIRGYLGDNIYSQLLRAKQLKDNAEYRKMYFDVNQANLQANREYQKQQDALNRAYKEKVFNYNASQDAFDNKIALANLEAKQNKLTAEELKEQRQLKQANKTIDVMKQAYAAVSKNPNAFGFFKGVTGPDVTNRLDPQGVEARSLLESVTAEYTKYLTGVQASDAERKRYERFLPNPRDNAEIIQKKIKGMLNVIATREGVEIPNLETTENTTTSTGSQSTNNQSIQVGNYKVRVK